VQEWRYAVELYVCLGPRPTQFGIPVFGATIPFSASRKMLSDMPRLSRPSLIRACAA